MGEQGKTPEHLLEETEKDTDASSHKRADLFRRAAELYRELGDESSAEVMDSLHLAFGAVSAAKLERFSCDKPRFIPTIYFGDAPPPLKEILTPQRCQHLRGFLEQTQNPAMRARLFDLLWEVERDHVAARNAADAYLEHAAACAHEQDAGACLAIGDALLRSLKISIQIGDTDRSRLALERLLGAVRSAITEGRPRSAFELVRELLACRPVRDQLPLAELHELIERAVQQLDADPLRHWEQMWLGNLERLGHVTGNLALVREARVRAGESLEAAGDFWAHPGGWAPAATFYQKAVAAYKAAGGCQHKTDAALKKLEGAVQSSRGDMREVRVQGEIPGDLMERWHGEVIRLYGSVGLAVLADQHYALPDVAAIREQAAKAQQEFVLQSLFPTTVLSENRVVRTAATPEEHLRLQFVQDLLRHIFFKLGHLTAWVFAVIREEGHDVREKVMEFLAESLVVSEQRRRLIERALERYEAGDYISSIHTLVFQVEGILRDFAGLLGQPVNEERDGITQARPLGKLLRDEKLREVLGDQLAESLEALLDNQAGPNIRNSVAHGLAAPEAFTEEIANLLIALLLQVSALGLVVSEMAEETLPDASEGECGGPQREPVE